MMRALGLGSNISCLACAPCYAWQRVSQIALH